MFLLLVEVFCVEEGGRKTNEDLCPKISQNSINNITLSKTVYMYYGVLKQDIEYKLHLATKTLTSSLVSKLLKLIVKFVGQTFQS